MPKIHLLSFQEAIAKTAGKKKPHILLGNGFSRAWRDDIFSYNALIEQANFEKLSPSAKLTFKTLDTSDFEAVMRALTAAASLINLYDPKMKALANKMSRDAKGLREVLVKTIAGRHPDRPGRISENEFQHAKVFLSYFNRIYTLNYDLLLYWTLMQDEIAPKRPFDDGFRTPDSGPTDYVTWEVEKTDAQDVYYLHGALHIFDAGFEIQKYTWVNTGVPLIDQIRQALEKELYPLFVSEAESNQKMARIRHSDILSRSFRSFAKIAGDLFVYGHSMSPNDEHIIQLIQKGKVSHLFVSLHGDLDSKTNKKIIKRCFELKKNRSDAKPIELDFYEASSAKIWR